MGLFRLAHFGHCMYSDGAVGHSIHPMLTIHPAPMVPMVHFIVTWNLNGGKPEIATYNTPIFWNASGFGSDDIL